MKQYIKPFLTAIGTLMGSVSLLYLQSTITYYVALYLNADSEQTRNGVIATAVGLAVAGIWQFITKAIILTIEYNERRNTSNHP